MQEKNHTVLTLRVLTGRAGAMAENLSGEPLLKEESELISEKTEMVLERGYSGWHSSIWCCCHWAS